MTRKILAAFLLAWCGVAFAQPPHRVTLVYELSYNGTVAAELTEVLEHDGKNFTLASEGRGKGIGALLYRGAAKRLCRGEIVGAGLRPLEYRDQRGDKPADIARFDWAKNTLTQEHEGKSETASMPAAGASSGASFPYQDRLSFLYNLAFQAAPDVKVGRQIKATLTDGKGLSQFQYQIAGKERLKTPAGELDTIHLVKQRENNDDRGTELWFASERDFLPVRILVIEKNGTRIDQVVTRIGN
jgi:hypothetical protein